MPNWCNNTLFVTAKSKKRLQEFMSRAKDTQTDLSLQNLYPMPVELDIESGSMVGNGLAILEYEEGKPEKLHEMLQYQWVKDLHIDTLNKLVQVLKEEKRADMVGAEQARKNIEKHGVPDWYEWRCKFWGTKWDVTATCDIVNDKFTQAVFHFDSAWAPPLLAFEKICADWPDLHFVMEYEELGMSFQGRAEFKDGQMISDESWELNNQNEDEDEQV